jgi:hypothetical protein
MKYKPEITIFSELQFDSMKPGQWFKWNNGARGQWLGKTLAGTDVVRYQADKFGKFSDLMQNKLKRSYAKRYGAK